MSNRRPSADDTLADDEKTFLNLGKLDLQTLSEGSPLLKMGLFLGVTALTFMAIWVLWLSVSLSNLALARTEDIQLRETVSLKQTSAATFDLFVAQRVQILRDIESVELALSRIGDMAGLLKSINRAGLGRGLQFEIFRPEKEVVHAHYAELPISVRVTGRYHSLGLFAADIAGMSHLVTLDKLWLTPLKDGNLVLEASLHVYRHLENDERSVLKKSSAEPGGSP